MQIRLYIYTFQTKWETHGNVIQAKMGNSGIPLKQLVHLFGKDWHSIVSGNNLSII